MTFWTGRRRPVRAGWMGSGSTELWFQKSAEVNIDTARYQPHDALQVAPVVGAVSAIATVAATADIVVEQITAAGEWDRVMDGLPGWADADRRPNPWQTRPDFLFNLAANKLVAGNAFVKIVGRRWNGGWPDQIVSIPFRDVSISVNGLETNMMRQLGLDPEATKIPGYGGVPDSIAYYLDSDVLEPYTALSAPDGDILHLRMWTISDVVYGVGPLQLARPPMRTALAADAYAELGFKFGFGPPGILANRGKVDEADIELARKYLKSILRDPSNRHGPLLTSGDWDFVQTFLPPEQLQLLGSREYTFHLVSSLFRVPPALMGAPGVGMSGSGIRNLQRYFTMTTCVPFLADIAVALSELLPRGFRVRLVPKHMLDLDPLEQSRVDDRLIRAGVLMPSEARRDRGLPDLGDDHDQAVCDKLWGTQDGGGSDSGKDEGEPDTRNTGEGME